MRRMLGLTLAATSLTLAACGSSKSAATDPATTQKASTATTVKAATATTAAPASGGATTAGAAGGATTAGAATGAAVAVSLKEWSIESAAVKAGAVTFDIKNVGSFPHELEIIKADNFVALPKDSGGAVDETKLADGAIVGKTRLENGATGKLNVTLAAGTYVFVCNLGAGANSHAAKGQHIDVTVS